MNASHWEAFAGLLDILVRMDGTWQEKAAALKAASEKYGFATNLAEIASWVVIFGDDDVK